MAVSLQHAPLQRLPHRPTAFWGLFLMLSDTPFQIFFYAYIYKTGIRLNMPLMKLAFLT